MDIDTYLRFLLALIFILALIGLLAWVARRFGLGGRLIPNAGAERRLSIVEVIALDSRRKVVLLRRDGAEHLVLLGPSNDFLLECGISATERDPELHQVVAAGDGTGGELAARS